MPPENVRVSDPKPAFDGLGVDGHKTLGVGAPLVEPGLHEANILFIDSACGVKAVGDMSAQRMCFCLFAACTLDPTMALELALPTLSTDFTLIECMGVQRKLSNGAGRWWPIGKGSAGRRAVGTIGILE